MFEFAVKYYCMILVSIFCFCKIKDFKLSKSDRIAAAVYTLPCAVGIVAVSNYTAIFNVALSLIFTYLFCKIKYKTDWLHCMYLSVISLTFAYVLHTAAFIISTPIATLLYYTADIYNYSLSVMTIILALVISVFQLIFAFGIFKIKRIKNGLPKIMKTINGDVGIIISFAILFCIIVMMFEGISSIYISVFVLAVIIFSLILILWYQKKIQSNYINEAQSRNIDILEQTVNEQKTELERLSKIIHKDNKVISALELSVQEIYKEVQGEKGIKLLDELKILTDERRVILDDYETNSKELLAKTNIFSTDIILNYLFKRSLENKIDFGVTLTGDIHEMTEYTVNVRDLNTMLADLGENAIIAVKNSDCENGRILVSIGSKGDCCRFDIMDNGIPFEPSVILNLNRKRFTTHKDQGGSGIGLMTTYELMKKYCASFEIEEFTDNSLFTKRVSVIFDGRMQTRVISKREEILAACSRRADIHANGE